MLVPIVSVVGRPNVGKSTLFNKIIGKRVSIVDDFPGVTRDGVCSFAEWNGKKFILVDTAGFNLDCKSSDILKKVQEKTQDYIQKSDAIIFVVDVKSKVTDWDFEIAKILKKSNKKVFLSVNKCDSLEELPSSFYEFYSLFKEDIFAISAVHGHGVADLLDCVVKNFKDNSYSRYDLDDEDSIKIAVLGKPNVGKSSLINKLLGEERLIVSEISGTTRDAIDVTIKYNDKEFTFIDTAGIRKKSKISENVEHYSILRSFMSVDRADIVILVIDALSAFTEQELKIAGYIKKKYKSSIIAINKWDLIKDKNDNKINSFIQNLKQHFKFISYSPHVFISAKTGHNLKNLYELIDMVDRESKKRFTTGILNEMLSYFLSKMPTPTKKGKKLKIYYITQISCKPPTFTIFVNDKKILHFSYIRYLENQIRKEFCFKGSPLKFIIKENKKYDWGDFLFLKIFVIFMSCVLGYIIASFNFAIFISEKFYNKNIKSLGSQNAGTTNMFANFGKVPALVTLIGDVLKGFLAILITHFMSFKLFSVTGLIYIEYLVLIFAVLGHIFPVFHNFKGGKGIAVTAGGMLFIDIKVIIALITIFLIVLKFSRIVSLGSLSCSIFYPIITFFFNYFNNKISTKTTLICTIYTTLISIILIFAHKKNIKRIIDKKERKIGKWGF